MISGRWVPPVYGSFSAHTSPSAGLRSITAATASGIAPRCTGMCSAWTTMRPAASNSAVEQSRRSLMLEENAARISTAPISSAIARSALPVTCSSTGTIAPVTAAAPARASRVHRSLRTIRPAPSTSPRPARRGPARRRSVRPPATRCSRRRRNDLDRTHGHELDLARPVGVAVALLVRTMEALLELVAQRNRELE